MILLVDLRVFNVQWSAKQKIMSSGFRFGATSMAASVGNTEINCDKSTTSQSSRHPSSALIKILHRIITIQTASTRTGCQKLQIAVMDARTVILSSG
ncbi:hypothetical protein ACFX2I_014886 [Malus domestica]